MSVNDLYIQSTKTQALTHKLALRSNSPMIIRYRGTTTTAVKTEIFIDGEANYRFQPPKGSVGHFRKTVTVYNETDTAAGTSSPEVSTGSFSRLGATTTVTEAATNTICDIEADDTNDWLTCQVTGADATDKLHWEVILEVFCLTFIDETHVMSGNYDGINK